MKFKCCLCVNLVIVCYRGVKDCGSAGRVHLNSVAGKESERVSVLPPSRGSKRKRRLFFAPVTSLSSISLLDMTPEAHPLIEDNVQGCVHPHACSHRNMLFYQTPFLPKFPGGNTLDRHCLYKMLCRVWVWVCVWIFVVLLHYPHDCSG